MGINAKFVGKEFKQPFAGDRVRILTGELEGEEVEVGALQGHAFNKLNPILFSVGNILCWCWPWEVEIIERGPSSQDKLP